MDKNELLAKLREPFPPEAISWKPGSLARDKQKAMALAYADLRAYQDRLDEVCGMDWSVSYTPWGDRIVCHLTIHGITRSSTGEPDMQSEKREIGGTVAEAQAFKRACAMFGLGRYLYELPSIWADYDAERNQFTDEAKKRLTTIIAQHHHHVSTGTEDRGGADPERKALIDAFNDAGRNLYGKKWERIRDRSIQRISEGNAVHAQELTAEQIQRLIDGIRTAKEKATNEQPVKQAA